MQTLSLFFNPTHSVLTKHITGGAAAHTQNVRGPAFAFLSLHFSIVQNNWSHSVRAHTGQSALTVLLHTRKTSMGQHLRFYYYTATQSKTIGHTLCMPTQVTAHWLCCCIRSTSVGKRNTCVGLLAKLLARIKAATGACCTRCVYVCVCVPVCVRK